MNSLRQTLQVYCHTSLIAPAVLVAALQEAGCAMPFITAVPEQKPWEIPPGARVLLTGPSAAWRSAPETAPAGWPFDLEFVQITATGVDGFPDWLLTGPPVSCARGANSVPIAEYVMAAILAHEKMIPAIHMHSAGEWRPRVLGEVAGKTLGLLGYGTIGREVAVRALAFGMKVVALRRTAGGILDGPVQRASDLPGLVSCVDHLVLAIPLTPETRHIICQDVLAAAKPGIHIVNVARGALIQQDDLAAALASGRVGAATLDVTDPEPLPDGHPFYTHPRIVLTPHISWSSADALPRLVEMVSRNLERFACGLPVDGIVNPQYRY